MSLFTSSENLAAMSPIYSINKPAYTDARVNGERKMTILVETAGFLQICLQLWVMFNLATCQRNMWPESAPKPQFSFRYAT